jgi:hypothetical protein
MSVDRGGPEGACPTVKVTRMTPEADIRPGRPLLYCGFICKDGLPVLGRVERRLAANMMPPAAAARMASIAVRC